MFSKAYILHNSQIHRRSTALAAMLREAHTHENSLRWPKGHAASSNMFGVSQVLLPSGVNQTLWL